jgi:hypothetical protein
MAFHGLFTEFFSEGLHHDEGVPAASLLAGNALRVVVFVAPVWLLSRGRGIGPRMLFLCYRTIVLPNQV